MSTPQPSCQFEPSQLELAMLAATIDPDACRIGKFRGALIQALALLDEAAELHKLKTNASGEEWRNILLEEFRNGNKGARNLLDKRARKILNKPEESLTLAVRDKDEDEARDYLRKNCNLEGDAKSWTKVRMVTDNLRLMQVDEANIWNLRRDEGAELDYRKIDSIVANYAKQPVVPLEHWRDGVREFDEFLERQKVLNGHAIPVSFLEALVKWKKGIGARGGVKKVRVITHSEVFPTPTKQIIPKKRKK